MHDEPEMDDRERLSILHVSQPTEGGVGRYVADLVADQVVRGWQVTVASPTYGDLADQSASAGARHVPWTAGRMPGPSSVLHALSLSRIVERERPDLVHLHSSSAGLSGRLAVRGRRPTIFQPHAWSFEAVRGPVRTAAVAWERMGARWATAIVCVSEAEQRRGEEHGIEARWVVARNGVDLTAFSEGTAEERSAARRRLELGEGPLVVCVGRLCRQKGQDVLLDAWPEITSRVPDAQLVLVGDGPDAQALHRRAGSGVRLVGRRTDVDGWLAAADVVALPSRWEGMSLGMLEAMARGRSIVATDVPGALEALDDEAGAVVPPEDAPALAEAIAVRLLDPVRAVAEGRRARKRAEQAFDLSATTARIAGVYEELLGSRSPASSSTGPKTP
jgi:glycosyltransferase involved in cell wall biosynthesis